MLHGQDRNGPFGQDSYSLALPCTCADCFLCVSLFPLFQFGSTIVLIFEAPKGVRFETPMSRVRVGDMLA